MFLQLMNLVNLHRSRVRILVSDPHLLVFRLIHEVLKDGGNETVYSDDRNHCPRVESVGRGRTRDLGTKSKEDTQVKGRQ